MGSKPNLGAVGTLAGGVVGSIIPGAGTMAGAAAGGMLGNAVGGLLAPNENPGNQGLQDIQNAGLGMANEAATDFAGQSKNRTDFANSLAQGALGQGPSLAQAQLQQAQDRSLAQQVAAAKANRAVNPALAARQSAQLGAQMQQANAQNAVQARLAEQRQQQSAYQNYLSNIQQSRAAGLSGGQGAAAALSQANQNNQNRQDNLLGGMFNTASSLIGAKAQANQPTTNLNTGGVVEDDMQYAAPALSKGAVVKGETQVAGDSELNDTVSAKLSPGEMVIPKSVVEAGPKEIHNFAAELLKRQQQPVSKKDELTSFGAVLAAKAHMTQKLKDLELKSKKER
jgi:hypothetical protein